MSYWLEYETDREAEQSGKWFTFMGGLQLKIARADTESNIVFAKKLQELQSNPENQDETHAARALIELYAGLVTGAKGLQTRDGKPLSYSPAAILDQFIALPELYKKVKSISNDVNNYKLNQAIDDLKK